MTDDVGLEQQIAEIAATLKIASIPDSVRKLLEKQLSDLVADKDQPTLQGTVNVSDEGRINGVVVGLNLGRIIFGRDPEEDERRRLVWYLTRLSSSLYRLPLRGLDEQLEQGKGIGLPQVYVMLATKTSLVASEEIIGVKKALRYFNSETGVLDEPHHPDWALPSEAIETFGLWDPTQKKIDTVLTPQQFYRSYKQDNRGNRESEHKYRILRLESIIDIVRDTRRLILLGDPGSGKSTFLRYLAWVLAQRGLDQLNNVPKLRGWDDQNLMLPVILPLRTLAGKLAQKDISEKERIVITSICDELQRYNVGQVDDLLREALHHGKVLLLCDGLDEVPTAALPGIASRSTVFEALQSFTTLYKEISVVVTCRTRAYYDNLISRESERKAIDKSRDWLVREVAPFTLGQIRHFVPAWYHELAATGQINMEQSARLEKKLIEAVHGNKKLQELARTPLLLTMMALVLYNKNELPRDRPQLYERILELLLGQWDKVRDGQSLSEAIGQPDWGSERIRPVLDLLSYQAHVVAESADGRGRLKRSAVRDALIDFFEMARLPEPWESARRCLDYFEQRSGLIQADEDDTYVFAHLTLQEHCAGRYMVLHRDAATLIMRHRSDDRWREPLFLGLGVIEQTKPELIDRVLTDLIDRDEGQYPKSVDLWQRDLILAGEIGEDRDWNYLRTQQVNVDRLQRDLKHGLIELLQDRKQPLAAIERVRTAFLLGNLGDPRFPVTVEAWQQAIARAMQGDKTGYFCYVKPGIYIVGSSEEDPDADNAEKPQSTITFTEPYLIARYPITNDQWFEWEKNEMEVNQSEIFPHSSSYPYEESPEFMHPNQPYCGVRLEAAETFCRWLSSKTGYMIRLPNEYEWEAAARGEDGRIFPWGNEWQEDRAACTYGAGVDDGNFPVGIYPSGASPCGALDMIGNVFELTARDASIDEKLIQMLRLEGLTDPKEDTDFGIIRGGCINSGRNRLRCAARAGTYFHFYTFEYGFRVMLPIPA
jgi:formylglycine-generating enzyme required for sulfatase activity